MTEVDSLVAIRTAHYAQAGGLRQPEIRWRDRQPFLKSQGYMLRPRLRPGWVPSWTSGEVPEDEIWFCEDYIDLPLRLGVVDATRIADGRLVYIKRLETNGSEAEIALLFSSPQFRTHIDNHCVPILDFFPDREDPSMSYLVMPFLRRIDSPPFEQVNDIVDVVEQFLKGLVFMHAHNVAHRDCADKNLLMDGTALYPDGFHPVMERRAATNLREMAWHHPRYTSPKPVTYYFVDFGISVHIPSELRSKSVTGNLGLDRDPPELSETVPYDPFKLDVFILGNFFKNTIYQHYFNVGFLEPLIEDMTAKDPAARPSAEEALQQWLQLRSMLGFVDHAEPLQPRHHRVGYETPSLSLLQLRIRMLTRAFYWCARLVRLIR